MRTHISLALACLAPVTACSDRPLPSELAVPAQPSAAVTVGFPGEDPGPPLYALFEPLFQPHTDEWAAIAFVRDPACVPADFNLLDVIHVPAAFGCPSKVEGHVTYKNGPPPIHVLMRGLGAVPIWFVAWPELQAAMSDGVLTVGDLEALPSRRVGVASFFHMTQHPGENRPQGLHNGKIAIVAAGQVTGGGAFRFQVREMGVNEASILRHVAIELD